MADKARFYLEQSIPDLQAYEKSKIFTKTEISSITKKRTDFEYRVNAPGTKAADYARYAEYEMNLEALRRKRSKRLGIKTHFHHGQRRIFFILDRATRKFHGDVGLWMQYIEYAKKEKASKVLSRTLSACLKLHPSKPELWIYAARHALTENGDMTEARSHLQRALRFIKYSKLLWIEYAKLEMVFIAKVLARRRLLGIDAPVPTTTPNDEDDDESMIPLPNITAEEIDPSLQKKSSIDAYALENVDTNPALNGAIAMAIFDSAMKEFPGNVSFAKEFFELFRSFEGLGCRGKLLEYVVRHVLDAAPTDAEALWLGVELPIVDVEVTDPIFPGRIGTVLANMVEALEKAAAKSRLYELFAIHFADLLKLRKRMDPAICQVIEMSLAWYFKEAEGAGDASERLCTIRAEVDGQKRKRSVKNKSQRASQGDKGLAETV